MKREDKFQVVLEDVTSLHDFVDCAKKKPALLENIIAQLKEFFANPPALQKIEKTKKNLDDLINTLEGVEISCTAEIQSIQKLRRQISKYVITSAYTFINHYVFDEKKIGVEKGKGQLQSDIKNNNKNETVFFERCDGGYKYCLIEPGSADTDMKIQEGVLLSQGSNKELQDPKKELEIPLAKHLLQKKEEELKKNYLAILDNLGAIKEEISNLKTDQSEKIQGYIDELLKVIKEIGPNKILNNISKKSYQLRFPQKVYCQSISPPFDTSALDHLPSQCEALYVSCGRDLYFLSNKSGENNYKKIEFPAHILNYFYEVTQPNSKVKLLTEIELEQIESVGFKEHERLFSYRHEKAVYQEAIFELLTEKIDGKNVLQFATDYTLLGNQSLQSDKFIPSKQWWFVEFIVAFIKRNEMDGEEFKKLLNENYAVQNIFNRNNAQSPLTLLEIVLKGKYQLMDLCEKRNKYEKAILREIVQEKITKLKSRKKILDGYDLVLMSPEIKKAEKDPEMGKLYVELEAVKSEEWVIRYIAYKMKTWDIIKQNECSVTIPQNFSGLQNIKKEILDITSKRDHTLDFENFLMREIEQLLPLEVNCKDLEKNQYPVELKKALQEVLEIFKKKTKENYVIKEKNKKTTLARYITDYRKIAADIERYNFQKISFSDLITFIINLGGKMGTSKESYELLEWFLANGGEADVRTLVLKNRDLVGAMISSKAFKELPLLEKLLTDLGEPVFRNSLEQLGKRMVKPLNQSVIRDEAVNNMSKAEPSAKVKQLRELVRQAKNDLEYPKDHRNKLKQFLDETNDPIVLKNYFFIITQDRQFYDLLPYYIEVLKKKKVHELELMSTEIENAQKVPEPGKLYVKPENGFIKYITDGMTSCDKIECSGITSDDGIAILKNLKKEILDITSGRGRTHPISDMLPVIQENNRWSLNILEFLLTHKRYISPVIGEKECKGCIDTVIELGGKITFSNLYILCVTIKNGYGDIIKQQLLKYKEEFFAFLEKNQLDLTSADTLYLLNWLMADSELREFIKNLAKGTHGQSILEYVLSHRAELQEFEFSYDWQLTFIRQLIHGGASIDVTQLDLLGRAIQNGYREIIGNFLADEEHFYKFSDFIKNEKNNRLDFKSANEIALFKWLGEQKENKFASLFWDILITPTETLDEKSNNDLEKKISAATLFLSRDPKIKDPEINKIISERLIAEVDKGNKVTASGCAFLRELAKLEGFEKFLEKIVKVQYEELSQIENKENFGDEFYKIFDTERNARKIACEPSHIPGNSSSFLGYSIPTGRPRGEQHTSGEKEQMFSTNSKLGGNPSSESS